MASTDLDADDRAAIAAFFRTLVQAHRAALLQRPAGEGFAAAPRASYFCAPAVAAQTRPADFELPAIESPDVFVAAMLRLWHDAGVTMDEAFARELVALAARLKSDETFEDEPPPFIYTL